jgi:hypothetical protein
MRHTKYKNTNQQINDPTGEEVKVLNFLATKLHSQINDEIKIINKLNELSKSSQSTVFANAVHNIIQKFSPLEIKLLLTGISQQSKLEATEMPSRIHIDKIQTPTILQQNIKRTKSGIILAFRKINSESKNIESGQKFKNFPNQSELGAGEFSLR